MRETAPVKGWGASSFLIVTSKEEALAEKCKPKPNDVPGTLPGRTEEHESGPWKIKYWCLYPSANNPGEYYEFRDGSWLFFWTERCQRGYQPVREAGSPMGLSSQIVRCVSSEDFAPGQPEVCCETAGNPILISSRRKVQTEVDYVGTGAFPLSFSRVYASGVPGRQGTSIDKAVPYWRHHYSRRLVGDLSDGEPRLPTRYHIIGYRVYPEPLVRGGLPGGDINALRPDGSVVYFPDGVADSNQRMALARTTLASGSAGWVLTTADDQREFYDLTGRLVALRSRSGETHSLAYNAAGQLISVTDDYGKSLRFSYEDAQLATLTDPEGNVFRYTYNEWGDVTRVTYPDTGSGATSRQYLYEAAARQLTGIIDERGNAYIRWSYDTDRGEEGLATESTGPDGIGRIRIDQTGSSSSGITQTTDSLGLSVNYRFDTMGGARLIRSKERVATATTPRATETRRYTDDGFLRSVTDWNGHTTEYERNSRGLPTRVTRAVGTDEAVTSTHQWHSDYRLPVLQTYPGYQAAYQYDSRGRLLLHTLTDTGTGRSRSWSFTYDSLGKVTSADGPRTDVNDTTHYRYYDCQTGAECGQLQSITNGAGHTVTLTHYNAHGQLTRSVDANGVVYEWEYDARQRLVRSVVDGQATDFTTDANGNITQVTLPDGTALRYEWDVVNRLIGIEDAQGHGIEWTLDTEGNRTGEKRIDPNGTLHFQQSQVFDALGRLTSHVPHHGQITTWTYDHNSNQQTVTDPQGHTTTSSYDAFNRLTVVRDALQGQTRYEYNEQGDLSRVTDAESIATQYAYNGFGDTTIETSTATGTTQFTHDEAGNVMTRTDARGITATYQYDALNRLIGIEYPDSSENVDYVYDQGANGIGRLSRLTDGSGSTDYHYDRRGNIVEVISTIGSQSYTHSYTYNAANRLTSHTYPSGRTINYTYDASGRIAAASTDAATLAYDITRLPFGPSAGLTLGNGIVRNRQYDQAYRLQSSADANVLARNYAYNAAGQISAISDLLTPNRNQLFLYDALNRLEFATGDYGENSYRYDAIGNRLQLEQGQGGQAQTHQYHYPADSHKLTSISSGASYTYDAVGNTLSNGRLSFEYNAPNRMTQATVNSNTWHYSHNALGQRVSQSGDGKIRHFIYDLNGQLIAEANANGDVLIEYAYLDGEPLALWKEAESQPVNTPSAIVNGGFETGLNDWISCSDHGGTQLSSDSTEGTQSVQISGNDCLYQEFSVQAGTTYTLQCQAKAQLTDYSSLGFQLSTSQFEEVSSTEQAITSTTWQTYQATLTATTDSAMGVVTLYSEDNAHFDACTVTASAAPPTTPPPTTPPDPPANNLLSNPGFESGLSEWYSCADSGNTTTVSDATEGELALQISGNDCLYQEFTVEPNKRYSAQCDAKGELSQYTSMTLTVMKANYEDLISEEVEVTSSSYSPHGSSITAPAHGAIGVLTVYSEDTGHFDHCVVVED